MKSVLSAIFIVLISTPVFAQVSHPAFNTEEDSLIWPLPGGFDNGVLFGHNQLDNVEVPYTIEYASRFGAQEEARLAGIDLFIDRIFPENPDSALKNYTNGIGGNWVLGGEIGQQDIRKLAVKVKAPYTGNLEQIQFEAENVFDADGNDDSLYINFYRPAFNLETSVSYYNPGTVWLFGLPRSTNNVTSYGVRFTAPQTVDSTQLSAVLLNVFSINDERFYSDYDTPANDSLLMKIYTVDENQMPDEMVAEQTIPFNEISAGFENRLQVSNEVYLESEQDFVVAYEVIQVDNQDYIGLVSGQSYEPPVDRSVMLENGTWKFISESDSWGTSGAEGAEINATAIFEDPNNGTPDEDELVANTGKIALNQFGSGDGELSIVTVDESVRLFKGEEIWAVVNQQVVGVRDSAEIKVGDGFVNPSVKQTAMLENEGGWKFTANTSLEADIPFKIQPVFRGEANDRLQVRVLTDENGAPGNEVYSRTVSLGSLEEHAFNYIELVDAQQNLTLSDTLHIALSLISLNDQDGIYLRSDAGDSVSGDFLFNKTNEESELWSAVTAQNGASSRLWMNIVYDIEVANENIDELQPKEFTLRQNYPNPFNPSTTITFTTAERGMVTLEVYDMLGRKVATLADENLGAGTHSRIFEAVNLSSGIYLYRLQTSNASQTKSMTLVK